EEQPGASSRASAANGNIREAVMARRPGGRARYHLRRSQGPRQRQSVSCPKRGGRCPPLTPGTARSFAMSIRSLPFAALPLALAGMLAAAEAPKFDPLPHKVSSLGACFSDGYVYVYGGHTGVTHTYSTETTTGKFFRAKLGGGKWEELTAGPAAQGLALVAHKGKIYRIGGMQPRNKPKEKPDARSLTDFAVYDPKTEKWADLTALPEGRSSHDAVVVGDKLYVF